MSLSPGVRLGAYEVAALIGAGGMGEVYRARDARLGRDVAIKVLPAALSRDPERLVRFEREARAAAALDHPNILAVHDVGSHDGSPFIVSELLSGESLRQRLTRGPLPLRKAVEYAGQIAHGLAAAHAKGVVHRDLKPENVFVTTDGRVKILDFGLAKLTQPASAGVSSLRTVAPNTEPGMVLGTFAYMSPEQARGLEADHRTDIFAFGALLYEMLAGQRAFDRPTSADTISAVLNEDPPELPATIPNGLRRIVGRCLEKDPALRFQAIGDVAFYLEDLPPHSDVIPAKPAHSEKRGERLAWAAGALLALASLATLSVALIRLRETPVEPDVIRFTVDPPGGASFLNGRTQPHHAVSPDGLRLAFVARRGGSSLLWVRALDSVEAQALAGTEGAEMPFWSPDSRFIGFFADGKLKKIDAAGGPPQTLCDAPPQGGTWNRDGVIVFGSVRGGLWRVPSTGGEPVAVTRPDPARHESAHRFPEFLPDGRRLLYLVSPTKAVHIVTLDSTGDRELLKADSKVLYTPPGFLAFVRGNTVLLQPFDAARSELTGEAVSVAESVAFAASGRAPFSVSERVLTYRAIIGTSQLFWMDRQGRRLETVGEPAVFNDLELAPDGRRAAVTLPDQSMLGRNIWLYDLARKVGTRFTFDPTDSLRTAWSPDGNRIAFNARRKGNNDLYSKTTAGAGSEELLLEDQSDKLPTSWSSDGRFLLFEKAGSETRTDLWVLALSAERRSFPFLQSTFVEAQGQFSRDGRWIAYMSTESGRAEVYVAPFSGAPEGPGGKWRISTAGGQFPRWRGDSSEVFYLAPDNRIMAAAVNGRGPQLEVGSVQPLFQITPGSARYDYAVSADGQRFLVNSAAETTGSEPMTVIVNWTAGLSAQGLGLKGLKPKAP